MCRVEVNEDSHIGSQNTIRVQKSMFPKVDVHEDSHLDTQNAPLAQIRLCKGVDVNEDSHRSRTSTILRRRFCVPNNSSLRLAIRFPKCDSGADSCSRKLTSMRIRASMPGTLSGAESMFQNVDFDGDMNRSMPRTLSWRRSAFSRSRRQRRLSKTARLTLGAEVSTYARSASWLCVGD